MATDGFEKYTGGVFAEHHFFHMVSSLSKKAWCKIIFIHLYGPSLKKWGLYWICLVLPSFCSSVITFQMKLEYLWGQLASLDKILHEASLGWEKGCIRFWDRLDQNWFPLQQKVPIDLWWGKQCLHLFSVVFDQIVFRLAGNEDRHKISARSDHYLQS